MVCLMKTDRVIKWLVAGAGLVAFRSAEAARGFGAQSGNMPAFRDQHPVAMVLINLAGLMLVLGVCALVAAGASRKSHDL